MWPFVIPPRLRGCPGCDRATNRPARAGFARQRRVERESLLSEHRRNPAMSRLMSAVSPETYVPNPDTIAHPSLKAVTRPRNSSPDARGGRPAFRGLEVRGD